MIYDYRFETDMKQQTLIWGNVSNLQATFPLLQFIHRLTGDNVNKY